jgi:glutathione S-transferase
MTGPESLSLYHFEGCPYCSRVRVALARLGVDLELRDIYRDPARGRELLAATGRSTVPCLRIADDPARVRWLHESAEIIRYLEARFAASRG